MRLRVRAPATNAPGGDTHPTVLKDLNILELHTKEHTVLPQQDCEEPGNPANPATPATPATTATRQHPAAPGSAPTSSQPGSTRQHPAADPANPAPGKPGNPAKTRQHPGNPATRPGNTRQPDNQDLSLSVYITNIH